MSLAKLVIFVGIGLAPLKQQSIFGHKVIPLSQRMLLAKQWHFERYHSKKEREIVVTRIKWHQIKDFGDILDDQNIE